MRPDPSVQTALDDLAGCMSSMENGTAFIDRVTSGLLNEDMGTGF